MKRLIIFILSFSMVAVTFAGEPKDDKIGSSDLYGDNPGSGGGHQPLKTEVFPYPDCLEVLFSVIEAAAKKNDSKVPSGLRGKILSEIEFYRKNFGTHILSLNVRYFSVISRGEGERIRVKTAAGKPQSRIIYSNSGLGTFWIPYSNRLKCDQAEAIYTFLQALLEQVLPLSLIENLSIEDSLYPRNLFSLRGDLVASFANALIVPRSLSEGASGGLTDEAFKRILRKLPEDLR